VHAKDSHVLSGYAFIQKNRSEIALDLTKPIQTCVKQYDTEHPVFHGCIDWHSAVHATWALIAYTNMTGDKRYLDDIDKILNQRGLEEEQKFINKNEDFEMPYGRAWFLRLAMEYEVQFKKGLLSSFADDIADSLVRHYESNPPDPLSKSYKNAAWALINLLEFGRYRQRTELVNFVEKLVNRYYFTSNATCQDEDSRPNFMGVCTNWAWLVGSVVEKKSFLPWVEGFMPAEKPIVPIVTATKAHEFGLNFSRCWGLIHLYKITGNKGYIDNYSVLYLSSYLNRSHWDGDYNKVGHWVAQFGLFALQPAFDSPTISQ
jgi:hypothetical protein